MKNSFLSFGVLILVCLTIHLSAQDGLEEEWSVMDISTENGVAIIKGNLEQGKQMPLEWAAQSNMACFPATRFVEYQGNHLLYRVQMPAAAKIIVTVKPKSKKTRINLYALRLGSNNYDTPPDIASAISCEAKYPIYAGKPNFRAPATEKSIEYISIRKPYNILIGVAGAQGMTAGDFELEVKIMAR
jgi:hypothetical protein